MSCICWVWIINNIVYNFHSCNENLDIIKVFYLPTDAHENSFKKNIKIYIKTAPTCFDSITTLVKIIN